jgi:hypothetical protein
MLQRERETTMMMSKREESPMLKVNRPPLSEPEKLLAGNLVLSNRRLSPPLPVLLPREILRY